MNTKTKHKWEQNSDNPIGILLRYVERGEGFVVSFLLV